MAQTAQSPIDWYDRRDELEPGQVFKTLNGEIIKLDRTVPGDVSERLADNYAGSV